MEAIIEKVRTRVLFLVSQQDPESTDTQDVYTHVETRDGLIRIFCEQFTETHKDCDYDVDSISEKIVETLKWRKTFGLTKWQPQDFPLELWNSCLLLRHEDDEYHISLYFLKNYFKISKRWSE